MKRAAIWLLLLVALAACATPGVPSEKASKIKSVAVVSRLGDELRLQYVGQTVFSNSTQVVPVDWAIDDHMVRALARSLSGKYEIRLFPYDSAAVFGARDFGDRAFGQAPAYVERLRAAAKPGFVDAYVVVSAAPSEDELGPSNQVLEGYAVYSRRRLLYGAPQAAAVYVSYQIEVIDGRNFERIGAVDGRIGGLNHKRNGELPSRAVNLIWHGEPYATIAEPQRQQVRSAILELIGESVPYTLDRLQLTR